VLAAGQTTTTKDNKPITVQAVTVLVDPKQAEMLAHATRQGQITLVLRARGDDSTLTKLQPVKTSDLRGKQAAPPAPPRVVVKPVTKERKPEEPKKVTIIRRTSKTEEQLPRDSTGTKQ
jgi:Flp pilus assembly protein CpaB